MAWIKIEKGQNREIGIRVKCRDGGLTVLFVDRLLAQLGWTEGMMLDLYRGTGEEEGQVRLEPGTEKTGWKIRYSNGDKTGLMVRFTKPSGFHGIPERLGSTPAEAWIVDNRALVVRLPWHNKVIAGLQDAVAHAKRDEKAGGVIAIPSEPVTRVIGQPAPLPDRRAPGSDGQLTNDPATWDPEVREQFIQSAATSLETDGILGSPRLAKICGRKPGSIHFIADRYLKKEIAARREVIAAARRVNKPAPPVTKTADKVDGPPVLGPVNDAYLVDPAIPAISEAVLAYFRTNVFPIISGIHTLKKSRDGTCLVLDDRTFLGPQEALDKINEMFELEGEDALAFPPGLISTEQEAVSNAD